MKWFLRILSLLFFLFGVFNFRQFPKIGYALDSGNIGYAIGAMIGAVFLWWFIAWLLWKASCAKKFQKE